MGFLRKFNFGLSNLVRPHMSWVASLPFSLPPDKDKKKAFDTSLISRLGNNAPKSLGRR